MSSAELDEFVNHVRERSDIYSVVSRYVPLTMKGGRYWACCPFHNEKTPSFTVTPEKGMFYCFGCGAGGNVFKFISMMENVSYFEAVKLQAQRLGIAIPSKNKSAEELQREKETKTLFKINELARDFYHECLTKSAEGETCRKYLEARGITTSVTERFKLGFAPDDWSRLSDNLIKRGFSESQLIAAGLVSQKKNGRGVYDRFRGRMMIPINDVFSHVVAFGGRVLKSDDEKNSPKYLNTSETQIFNKRQILFGLDMASRKISAANFAVVVEGYMDAISLFSAGIENVVATLGTAFTVEHAKLLMRYAKRIIFCYDSDEAGQRATMRALPIVRDEGADVSVVTVPDGKDPDEFIRKHGRKAFEKLIKNSVPLVDYRIKYVLAHTEYVTLGGKIDALRKILPVVVDMKDAAMRNEYRKKIASVLVLDENVVSDEWEKFLSRPTVPENTSQKNSPTPEIRKPQIKNQRDDALKLSRETIVRMAWQESDTLSYILSLIPKEAFNKTHREIISYLEKCLHEDRRPNDVSAAAELSEEANAEISRLLAKNLEESEDAAFAAFEDSIKSVRLAWLKFQNDKILKEAVKYISSDKSAFSDKIQKSLILRNELGSVGKI